MELGAVWLQKWLQKSARNRCTEKCPIGGDSLADGNQGVGTGLNRSAFARGDSWSGPLDLPRRFA
jgi:hypothetical protein